MKKSSQLHWNLEVADRLCGRRFAAITGYCLVICGRTGFPSQHYAHAQEMVIGG